MATSASRSSVMEPLGSVLLARDLDGGAHVRCLAVDRRRSCRSRLVSSVWLLAASLTARETDRVWYVDLFLRGQPWAGPGVIVSLVVAVIAAVCWRRHRALPLGTTVSAALLVFWIGAYLSVTLTPGPDIEFGQSRSACVLVLEGPAGLLHVSDRVLNVLLSVPAGVMTVLSRGRLRLWWVVFAVVTPVIAELVQYLQPWLERVCDLTDVQDAWEGFVLGAALGVTVVLVRRGWRGARAPMAGVVPTEEVSDGRDPYPPQ